MRTRKSNSNKRYSAPDYGLDSDGEGQNDIPEDNSEEEAAYSDEGVEDVADDEDELDDTPDQSVIGDVSIPNVKGEVAVISRPRPSQRRQLRDVSVKKDATDLIPYPTDSRLTSTRLYHGMFQKLLRTYFYDDYYGPGNDAVATAVEIFRRWATYEILPSKLLDEDKCPFPTPWVAENFEGFQASTLRHWLRRYFEAVSDGTAIAQQLHNFSGDEARSYLVEPGRELAVLLGTGASEQPQIFARHHPVALNSTGVEISMSQDEPGSTPNGWMFDVGGLVACLAWAPRAERQVQVLSLAVHPFTDQDLDAFESADVSPTNQFQTGMVQLWTIQGRGETDAPCEPSPEPPRLACTLLLDCGRAKRLLWCPASPSVEDDCVGLLGMLGADGVVHVVRVDQKMLDGLHTFEKVGTPMVSLGLFDEDKIEATVFAWVGINRVVTGHVDGSIALWSLYPNMCIFRHAVHHSHVLHMATGYPSQPYLVASHPVSGTSALIDLTNPSTYVTTTTNSSITPSHSMLEWCDHLQGFVSMLPSSKPLNTAVGLFHSRTFSTTPRKIIEGDSLVCAISAGVHHPFVMTALLDGSVWVCNPMNRTFLPRHSLPGWKLKIFQQEHVPRTRFTPPTAVFPEPEDDLVKSSRGISLITQGFKPKVNQGFKALEFAATGVNVGPKTRRKPRDAKSKKKPKTEADHQEGGGDDADEGGMYADPSKLVAQEPLSRTMAMAWNPNLEFATWAAFGMASGLVRVQNLGVEH